MGFWLASLGLSWFFAMWLAAVFGLSLRGHPQSLNDRILTGIWGVIFLVGFLVLIVTSYIIGSLANVLICRYLLGWSSKKIRATFVEDFKQPARGYLSLVEPQWNKMRDVLIKWLEDDARWSSKQ